MRMIILAASAAVLGAPAVAQSIQLGSPQFEESYATRGACQSALAHERNSQRKDPTTRGAGYEDLSTSDFQSESLRTTRCELGDDGWQVMFNADGFDDADE
jgi:hypothetical protein